VRHWSHLSALPAVTWAFVQMSSPGRCSPYSRRVDQDRPLLLRTVCVLVVLEAVALVGLGVAWVVDLVRDGAEVPGAVVFLALCCGGLAALLAGAARGLWNHRRWARSPVMFWQLLLLLLGIAWLNVEATVWGFAVVIVALAVGVGLLLPSVVAATTRTDSAPAGGEDGVAAPSAVPTSGGTRAPEVGPGRRRQGKGPRPPR
jgi:hypothetical protein